MTEMRFLKEALLTYYRIIFALYLSSLTMVAGDTDYEYQEDEQPVFLSRPTNVSFNKGDTAVLVCGIDNLGTKTVSWRRASDPNPLTIGSDVYVGDPRYTAAAIPEQQEWRLYIHDVQSTDAGVYECQISSRAKLIQHILLRVNASTRTEKPDYVSYKQDEDTHEQLRSTSIYVSGTKFVEKGDPIHLVCNSTGIIDPPENLDWFRDGIKLTPDGVRQIKIDKFHVRATRTLVSVLEVKHSRMEDAGTYVCRSSDLSITSTKVHVLNAGSTNVRRGTSATDKAEEGEQEEDSKQEHSSKGKNSAPKAFSTCLMPVITSWAVNLSLISVITRTCAKPCRCR